MVLTIDLIDDRGFYGPVRKKIDESISLNVDDNLCPSLLDPLTALIWENLSVTIQTFIRKETTWAFHYLF